MEYINWLKAENEWGIDKKTKWMEIDMIGRRRRYEAKRSQENFSFLFIKEGEWWRIREISDKMEKITFDVIIKSKYKAQVGFFL